MWDVHKWNEHDSLVSTPRLTAPSRSLTFGQRYGVVNEIVWNMWFPHRQHHGSKRFSFLLKSCGSCERSKQKVEAICVASTCSCSPIWQVDVNSQNSPNLLKVWADVTNDLLSQNNGGGADLLGITGYMHPPGRIDSPRASELHWSQWWTFLVTVCVFCYRAFCLNLAA